MAYYRTCPDCGCSLDPGEKCDCLVERAKKQEEHMGQFRQIFRMDGSGQMVFAFEQPKGCAVGAWKALQERKE